MINDPNKDDQLDDNAIEPDFANEESMHDDSVGFDDDPYQDDPTSDDLDFDDMDDDFDDDVSYDQPVTGGSSVNWFNVFIFGFLAVAIIGTAIFYVPRILGGMPAQNAPQQQQQAEAMQLENGTAEDNQQLAEEAVSMGANNQMAQQGGLLNNPELLSDTANETAVQEATAEPGEEVFNDLNLNNLRAEQQSRDIMMNESPTETMAQNNTVIDQSPATTPAPQPLPVPSDTPVETMDMQMPKDDEIIFEPLSPRGPAMVENDMIMQEMEADTSQARQQPQIATSPVQNEALAQQVQSLSADVEQLSAQLQNFMDTVAERAEQIENRISQVDSGGDIMADGELRNLKSTIADLEQRIASLQAQEEHASPRPQPQRMQETDRALQSNADTSRPTPRPQAIKPTRVTRSIDWTLRGASRGEAIIADPASGATRTVTVGDTIDGLGRITAITMENNRWVVRGSNGVVRQ